MRRVLAVVTLVVAGITIGGAATLGARDPSPPPESAPGAAPDAGLQADAPLSTPAVDERPPSVARPTPAAPRIDRPARRLLLAWSPRALPEGFARMVAGMRRVTSVTAVSGDLVDLVKTISADGSTVDDVPSGWAVPIDALAIEPRSYAQLMPPSAAASLSKLGDGRVLLSETSARVRRVGPGATLVLRGGVRLVVAGVVDDALVGAAELVAGAGDARRLGLTTQRFVLIGYEGRRPRIESRIRALIPDGLPVRIRGPGETPYLRNGDAVLPQALIKLTFGEFAYRPPDGGSQFTQDPAWVDRNVVTRTVPILGKVTCHRTMLFALEGALRQLRAERLARLVDPDHFAGCWNPRLIAPNAGLSRHAWGIAVDINSDANPTGLGSGQDPRLVDIMSRWGFTWGGPWLIPDPMHFEYVEPPAGRL